MQFKKVRVMVDVSLTSKTAATIYEHEVPILQAVRGTAKVNIVEPSGKCGIAREPDIVKDGKVAEKGKVIDFNLEDEWNRLMFKPKMVQVGENQTTPAPLMAFPRGLLDLEDFYARIRKPHSSDEPKPSPVSTAGPDKQLPAKEIRAATKSQLDALGIEYRGNASTDDLVAMLSEVSTSASIQNEG